MKQSDIPENAVVVTCIDGVVGLLRNPTRIPVFCIDYDIDEVDENQIDSDESSGLVVALETDPV